MKKRSILAVILGIILLSFSGCTVTDEDSTTIASQKEAITTTPELTSVASEETSHKNNDETKTTVASVAVSLKDIPKYTGLPYSPINNNTPFFEEKEMTTEPFETYSSLDSLGRCGVAYANICTEIMPTEERGAIGNVRPSGWHSVRYENVDGKYLYNRCHLIGYQLAGENANEENLITGTRYLNVEGMLPFENMVADYVNETGNHVLYRVTPMYNSNCLVASGVLMEAYSVEDNGAGIEFNIFCYNVQPGIDISYDDGSSNLEAGEEPASELTTEQITTSQQNSETVHTFILNTNTKKYHEPGCRSVATIKDENRQEFSGTVQELEQMGYSACKNCH